MFIDFLNRHLAVCAQKDLPRMAKADPDFWNLVSIREPARPRVAMRGFRRIQTVICYDMIGLEGLEEGEMLGIPRKEHLQAMFQFADSVPEEPLLVHCWAGVSRSTAVALALIVRGMYLDGYTQEEITGQAPELLLAIRPQAAPNPLMLELGLSEFLNPEDARQLMVALVNHPVLLENRFNGGGKI